mmetsp:Transcript_9732/g.14000  ORF Transcript_9732/g.14000 Transcript_9732/m.14000 type:complete len:189 (+) Transcript_9732:153-719(+)|eukprot:CAMPEP_0202444880 /NCGR_PEP_ID=MMETSP1360-20130828/3804_1 /ASSEMBLY_ACC=CAM_ASM_000848 /TAXON_ID=515479 /ORGANISM="Licmophora paradoxa, Strain CCMP2313" /LENGTH=188 /DNA_ID=CAMNT_0049060973 /DNA_START=143 /DNA_END=709 /DNA_ORIENTATION=+
MTSLLSPLAQPFHPHYSQESFQVFNDGIPAMTSFVQGDLIRLISDEAIDECYPPATATDAAEIEEAERFCAIMARLEAMEELEELTRHDLASYYRKRWQARRTLQDKPKPARNLEQQQQQQQQQQRRRNRSNSREEHITLYDRRYHAAVDAHALEIKHIHGKSGTSKLHNNRRGNSAFKIKQPRSKGY